MTLYWRHQVCRSDIGMTHIMSKWFSFDVNLCSQNLVMTLYFFTGCAITQLQVPIAESNKAWNEKLSRARQSRKKSSTPHMAASGGQTFKHQNHLSCMIGDFFLYGSRSVMLCYLTNKPPCSRNVQDGLLWGAGLTLLGSCCCLFGTLDHTSYLSRAPRAVPV